MRALSKAVAGVTLSAILGGCGEAPGYHDYCHTHEINIQTSPPELVDRVTPLGGFVTGVLTIPPIYWYSEQDCDPRAVLTKYEADVRRGVFFPAYNFFGITIRDDGTPEGQLFSERQDYSLADVKNEKRQEIVDLIYRTMTAPQVMPDNPYYYHFAIPDPNVTENDYEMFLEELVTGQNGFRFANFDPVVSTGKAGTVGDFYNVWNGCQNVRYVGLKLERTSIPQMPDDQRKVYRTREDIISRDDRISAVKAHAVFFVVQPPCDQR